MLRKPVHPLRGRLTIGLLLILAVNNVEITSALADCPRDCSCKWTSGKKSAFCQGANFKSLPKSLDTDTQVLDLSRNNITALEANLFLDHGLVNLQRVFLRDAGVREVSQHAFREMRILVEIDLSDNRIKSLEPSTFEGNERLMVLILNRNPLSELHPLQFPFLNHLRTIELRHCRLHTIHLSAFERVPNLEKLELDNNTLKHLDARVFNATRRIKTLSLDGNPWECDCRLREFRNLLVEGKLSRLYLHSQRCSSPKRLEDRLWEKLRSGEFACKPTVKLVPSTFQTEINGNLTLGCLVSGDPEPDVRWQLNGAPVNESRPQGKALASYLVEAKAEDKFLIPETWSNLTLYNASEFDDGEYTCLAQNVAGAAHDTATITVPRVLSAPAISQSDDWLLWAGLAGGGAATLCLSAAALLIGLCLCGNPRRRSRREKVKLQSSGSFGEQEKKLLDLSVTTSATTTTTASAAPGGIPASPGELELAELEEPASVTVERLRAELSAMRAMPCLAVFPTVSTPPPPPPPSINGAPPGGIFISVSLSHDPDLRYPDLLDIPGHGHQNDKATNTTASLATLPRRRSHELGISYDNMGPRLTAAGSSTFSLIDPDIGMKIPPPPEFVSL